MGIGDFLQDRLDDVANAFNTVDRYTNPFHVEVEREDGKAIGRPERDSPLAEPVVSRNYAALERAAFAWNWFYSNAMSQPVTTFNLMAGQSDKGNLFSAVEWNQAWHAAEHISPGQSLGLLFRGGPTLDPSVADREVSRAIDSPLKYYEPQAADLPPEWEDIPFAEQQRILQESGMPAIGNRYVEKLREDSDLFKYGSGTIDFAARIWADPTIIGLRGLGALRRTAVTKRRPSEGWSSSEIDNILNKSVMTKAKAYIYANRENPQLLNNLALAQKSAMGPRFGHVASMLKTEDEVADFLRVGMGDVRAFQALEGKNALAAVRLKADATRLASMDLMRTRYAHANPHMARLAEKEMERLEAAVNADTALVSRYDAILAHADELDALNLSRWGFTRAGERTAAQNVYQAGAGRKGRTRYRPLAHLPEPLVARRLAAQDTAAADAKASALAAGKSERQANAAAIAARQSAVPFGSGLVKTRVWGLGDFYSTPITLVRALREKHPNGTLRLDDIDDHAITEVRGHLARIPNIRPETRQKILNQYLKTATEAERRDLLHDVGRLGAARVAEKHGLDAKAGVEIFEEHLKRQLGEIDNMKRYSAATKDVGGKRVRVDEFRVDGGKVVLEPFTVSRLVNSHALQSLDDLDKVLARHAGALRALRESRAGNPDWILDAADYLSHLWKFTTLFRFGYIPRVLGDDLAGQWARATSAAMAARIGWGVKNGATNLAHRSLRGFAQAREKVSLEAIKHIDGELAILKPQMRQLGGKVSVERTLRQRELAAAERRVEWVRDRQRNLPTTARPATTAALNKLFDKRILALQQAQRRAQVGVPGGKVVRLRDMEAQQAYLERFRALETKAIQDAQEYQAKRMQGMRPVTIGDTTYSPAMAGREGELAMKLISADDSVAQIFNTNKQLLHGQLQRSFDHGGKVVSVAQDEAAHLKGWSHALNNQMGQDALSRLALQGASVDDMSKWLTRTPQGRAYRARLPKMLDADQVANAAWHEAAEYAPDPLIRMAALEGKATTDFLKTAVPNKNLRPYEVHIGQTGNAQLAHANNLDRLIQFWFKWAATVPANRMSRHPLYNQLYEGHLKSIHGSRVKQGAKPTTVDELAVVERAARRLAVRDTRKLVFDIAHRSDAAAALRFMSPFFSATAESFQRWARIIGEKPQTVGYAANFFNAPMAMGAMQDMDGNQIMPSGHVWRIDPKTGKAVKRMVPKAERYIIARMPRWLVESPMGVIFGVERASGNMALSQNSMNIVTQGDPWFNPGVGPVVAIPVNEWVKDKPDQAAVARHLGVLPFGPQQGGSLLGYGPLGRAAQMALPQTAKSFLTAFDTSDDRYQRIKLHITQKAAYEHENQGKRMLTASEIASKTREYWLFSAGSAFLQPMATQRKDAYQFYRDQYNALRRADPMTADMEFLERFGESYFVFAQAETRNVSGIQATNKAVKLSQEYKDLLEANPELGALIVGAEGNGPFSREAYAYQLNSPLIPGDSEMQRKRMSASEAMKENKRREGWAKFTAAMNRITADLHNAGFESFADEGAEEFAAEKRNFTALYGEPLFPDGEANPHYNEEWSKDFYSLDPKKYDRLIPGLTTLARSRLANEPHRSDLRVLQEYLGARQWMNEELARRGASGAAKTLNARANSDLRFQWVTFVDSLRERDTRFGDLHTRYLSRDLGVDVEDEAEEV